MHSLSKNFCAALAFSFLSATASWAGTQYSVTELSNFPGGVANYGSSINPIGQATGEADTGGFFHAYLYNSSVMKDLGTLGGKSSQGFSINSSGEVAGASELASNAGLSAFLYNGSSMKNLGALGGSFSQAHGINNLGFVAGAANLAGDTTFHAFLYDGSVMHDLGTLGGTSSSGSAINSSGEVTGFAMAANGNRHAFIYDGTSMKDLGVAGPNGVESFGNAINDIGQVVGNTILTDLSQRAFLYNGTLHDLGTLGGGASNAFGINSGGQVVGWSDTAGGTRDAYIYFNGVMTDLNSVISPSSGIQLSSAVGINDAGQILVQGTDASNHSATFLLTPVPEPTFTCITILATTVLMCRTRKTREVRF